MLLFFNHDDGWGSVDLFNPAEYHYDSEILDARRATQETARALNFSEGFNGAQDLINKIQAQINAIKEEAKLRELKSSEVSKVRELVTLRKDVTDGLAYANNYANGDLDAEIYKDGKSFNQKWGVMPKSFFDKAKSWLD